MHSVFTWSPIRSFASRQLERQGLKLNIIVTSMPQIPCKVLYVLYFVSFSKVLYVLYSVSFNTRRPISLLQLSSLLFVREEEKKKTRNEGVGKMPGPQSLYFGFLWLLTG